LPHGQAFQAGHHAKTLKHVIMVLFWGSLMRRQTVVVLGASPKAERYSNQAVRHLLDLGHTVLPVNPAVASIWGLACVKQLLDIQELVDTLTVYVGKKRSDLMIDDILALKPQRLILNPGAENEALQTAAEQAGIEVVLGCTLVMLKTQQF
jgi:predicted CoA-binding protein